MLPDGVPVHGAVARDDVAEGRLIRLRISDLGVVRAIRPLDAPVVVRAVEEDDEVERHRAGVVFERVGHFTHVV